MAKNKTMIPGKDSALEDTIEIMTAKLKSLGINIEIVSWLNPIPHVWSVHIRDADSPMCFTNGKGASKNAALASALGEYFERISCNYFYADWFLGKEISLGDFVHYPNEEWFKSENNELPIGLMDEYFLSIYNFENDLKANNLIDTNSGNVERGICAIPFVRQSDQEEVYIPVNLIGNLYVSNGMSAGNTASEARVQCLSEIFERYVKNKIISEELSLPDIPSSILERYPRIQEAIGVLEKEGFPVLIKDASLGGKFPVINVTLMNPKNGGVFASFGAHPKFEVALERTLTELLQGRSLDSLDVVQAPSFASEAVCNHDNIEDHFIDSTGILSWKFFNNKADYQFSDWNFSGTTSEEFSYLMSIFIQMEKDVYIADYNHLDVCACRILVPTISEIYPVEDLVWDNNNRSILFRENILNIHSLNDDKLNSLVNDLEESELDDQMPIVELIGVAFDSKTTWAELTIGELKALIFLALKKYPEAKEMTELYLNFNDSNPIRRNFIGAIDTLLTIVMSEKSSNNIKLELSDYIINIEKLYGKELSDIANKTVLGEVTFYGLTKTSMGLEGLTNHHKLIESYQKLQCAKRNFKN